MSLLVATGMTAEQRETVGVLMRVLPPIVGIEVLDQPNPLRSDEPVCLDLEWSPTTGALETIGFGNERVVVQLDWKAWPDRHDRIRQWVETQLGQLHVVIQNADGDIRKLRANGFRISGPASFFKLDDPMLAHAVLHSEEDHDLGYLNAEYGTLPPYKHLRTVKGAESVYNAADVVSTVLVWKGIERELQADPLAAEVYRQQSLPFLWLAIEQEEAGIRVVPGVPEVLYAVNDLKRQQAVKLLQAYCGWPVNINSPDQMKHVLYTLEGFPVQRAKGAKWGEEGEPTTNKDAIAAMRRMVGTEWEPDEEPTLARAWANIEAGGNPALEARYLYMGAQQAITHYIEPCLGQERIYPECRIHVQASGRVGYVGPALPQMKDDILEQIAPDLGHVWMGWDWKQIEVRLLAVEANDIVYLRAFEQGVDIHDLNARAIFGARGSDELEALRRRWIKAFVFRLHYRGKAENTLDIPGTNALFGGDTRRLVEASERYLSAHQALPDFWAKCDAEADRTGMVRTFMGRPRRLTSQWAGARRREASNHKMQGGVSDIFITTALKIKQAAPWARLVFGAYDSQFWQVPVDRQTEFLGQAAPIVGRAFTINGHTVSFPADWKLREAA